MNFIARIKQKLFSLFFISTLSLFIPKLNAYADEVYVYCAASKEKWHWLEGKNVKVSGEWKYLRINFFLYYKYFKIEGDINLVTNLQSRCISEFGEDFKYAQPADSILSGWHTFGLQNDIIFNGIFDYLRSV